MPLRKKILKQQQKTLPTSHSPILQRRVFTLKNPFDLSLISSPGFWEFVPRHPWKTACFCKGLIFETAVTWAVKGLMGEIDGCLGTPFTAGLKFEVLENIGLSTKGVIFFCGWFWRKKGTSRRFHQWEGGKWKTFMVNTAWQVQAINPNHKLDVLGLGKPCPNPKAVTKGTVF